MTNDNQHIPAGYKPSPLGPIPEDWEVKRIGDFAPLQRGFDLPTDKIVKGRYPVVYSNGILNYHNEFKAKAPGVVTGRSGTIGKVTFVESDYWPHNTSLWVTDFKNNNPKYVFHLYKYIDLSKFASGSGVPTLNRNDVHAAKIAVPPLLEQQRIVDVLELWDTAIAKQTALIEQLTLRKRGLMQQLLTGKKRLKGFCGEWKEVRLGEICPMERGEMLTSDNYLQGNIPVIAGGKEPAGFHSYSNRQKNTITISCSGASAGFVAFHDVPIFATDCFTISESNAYNVWFIYHVLTNLQEKIYKLQTGGAQPHVHPKDVYPMKIHIPSIKEQNVIASVLVNADKEIEIQKQKLAAMQEQKKGLMQVLLSGKKRIKK